MILHDKDTGPVGQLSPQDWLEAPETQDLIAALTADGGEVRFVGGCVRDSVLKRAIKDVDVASRDAPEKVIALLERAGIRVIPTGIAHGTVTAVIGHAHFEITTLREDVESFGRHARVAFTDDWIADAARRDFTMNAMFADIHGRVYDPFNGLPDLAAGHVRFVGDSMKRIDEDVLRLLRFFRFHAHYGRGAMDGRALTACRKQAHRLVELSGERVAGELLRLLQAPDPAAVLLIMRSEGILRHILPETGDLGRLKMLTWLETRAMVRDSVFPDHIRRLGCILNTDSQGVAAMGERLKLSKAQVKRLTAMAAPKAAISLELSDREARNALYDVGADEYRDLVLCAWATARSMTGLPNSQETERWMHLLDLADDWAPVGLPLRGADCLALGVPRGPAVGRALAAVEQWWRDQDFGPDHGACLAKLTELIKSGDAAASPGS